MTIDRYDSPRYKLPVVIAIACFAVLALLLTSWDSYLYDLWQHRDVIWFYSCGKAWMNGLTPYVDFADSKGPLLWLIYGIGYLLSPHDYVGCYWIACVLYAVIFYWCYKCALLYTRNQVLAVAAVVISALFFLGSLTHVEVRTEDYCYPPMLAVFYRFLQHSVARCHSRRFVKRAAIVLGIALGVTLLIKYSCTLMLAVFIPYFCIVVPRRSGYSAWRATGWCALAGMLTVAPMLIALALQGCLGAFINEYFLVTASTFDNLHGSAITFKGILLMFMGMRLGIFMLAIVVGMLVYLLQSYMDRWYALLVFFWFLAVVLLNGTDRIYFNVLALFTVLFAGLIVIPLARWLQCKGVVALLAIGVLASLFFMTDRESLFNQRSAEQTAWHYYASLMAQYDKPRTLYLMCHDHGEGVPARSLPACKYWSLQMGHTQAMLDNQLEAVKQGQCDVVFVMSNNVKMAMLMESMGYHRYDFTDIGVGEKDFPHTFMYSRRQLHATAECVPSSSDILFKRHLYGQ